MGSRVLFGGVALGLVGLACDVPEYVPPSPPPEILRFEVEPFTVPAGSTATLRWAVARADRVRVEGLAPDPVTLPPEGTREVEVRTTLELTLVAENAAGVRRARARASVETSDPVRITRFELAPPRVRAGAPVQIRWETENARGARLDVSGRPGVRVPPIGAAVLRPTETATVRLTAEGAPRAVTATLTLAIAPDFPVISRFSAEPAVLYPDTPVQLTATFEGFSEARISERTPEGDVVLYELDEEQADLLDARVTLNQSLAPPDVGRHVYVLTVDGGGRRAEASTEVVVLGLGAPRVEALTLTPTVTGPNGDVVIEWRTRDAASAQLAQPAAAIGDVPRSGARTVQATRSGPVRLTVRAPPDFVVERRAELTVEVDWPHLVDVYGLEPHTPSGTATVGWTVREADRVDLVDERGQVVATSTEPQGLVTFPVDGPRDLDLVACNTLGRSRRHIRLVPGPRPTIERLEAPAQARTGQRARIAWQVQGAERVELLALGTLRRVPAVGELWVRAQSFEPSVVLFAESPTGLTFEERLVQLLPPISGDEVEPNDDYATANTPFGVLPASTNGEVGPGDVDVYAVTLGDGDRLSASTQTGGCSADVVVEVWRDLGSAGPFGPLAVAGGDGACAELDEISHPELARSPGPFWLVLRYDGPADAPPAPYRLRMQAVSRRCGDRVLDLREDCDDGTLGSARCSGACTFPDLDEQEPNDAPEFPDAWVGETFRGSLVPGDVDQITFAVGAADAGPHRIALEDEAAGVCGLAARLRLFDADGALRAEAGPGSCPELSGPGVVLEPGAYRLRVSAVDPREGVSRGRYTLRRSR